MEDKLDMRVKVEQNYKCEYCGERFRLKATLISHRCEKGLIETGKRRVER